MRKSAERDARLEMIRPVKRTMPTSTFGGELVNDADIIQVYRCTFSLCSLHVFHVSVVGLMNIRYGNEPLSFKFRSLWARGSARIGSLQF